jgi:hypothetical protein
MSSSNILLTLSYCGLFSVWALSYVVLIPVSLNLVLTSSFIIYIGSHRSLRLLISEKDGGAKASEKEVISAQGTQKDYYYNNYFWREK